MPERLYLHKNLYWFWHGFSDRRIDDQEDGDGARSVHSSLQRYPTVFGREQPILAPRLASCRCSVDVGHRQCILVHFVNLNLEKIGS